MSMLVVPGAGWGLTEPACCDDCKDVFDGGGDFRACPVAVEDADDRPPPEGVTRLARVVASLSDDRRYRVVALPNGLRVALVSDAGAKKAAASCCVGVGAYADTKDLPGLAHFLEHMLFQGTTTYPEDNAYKAYVARHGGSTNASTSGERTTFQFDVVDAAFEGALDRFGRFFVEPLLKAECVDREMHAVDAEHSKNVNDGEGKVPFNLKL